MFGLYDNWGKARSIKSDDNNTNPSIHKQIEEDDEHEITKTRFPEDGRLVGTDSIFISSPNVIPHHSSDTAPNPHKRRGIPTPSIYTDERGEIHNIKANDKRINIVVIYIPIHNVILYSVVVSRYGRYNQMDLQR